MYCERVGAPWHSAAQREVVLLCPKAGSSHLRTEENGGGGESGQDGWKKNHGAKEAGDLSGSHLHERRAIEAERTRSLNHAPHWSSRAPRGAIELHLVN